MARIREVHQKEDAYNLDMVPFVYTIAFVLAHNRPF